MKPKSDACFEPYLPLTHHALAKDLVSIDPRTFSCLAALFLSEARAVTLSNEKCCKHARRGSEASTLEYLRSAACTPLRVLLWVLRKLRC